MNWLGCLVLILAVLKLADIVLAFKNMFAYKSKCVMMIGINDVNYHSAIRQSVSRFLDNKYYFSKLVFVAECKDSNCFDYCRTYIENFKNVELLLKEDLNEKLIDNCGDG